MVEEGPLQTAYSIEEESDEDSIESLLSDWVEGLKFSIPSNSLFFLGSLCYVWMSIHDWLWLKHNPDYYNDDPSSEEASSATDDYSYYYSYGINAYKITGILGSLCFILNVLTDLYRCRCDSKEINFSLSAVLSGESESRDLLRDCISATLFGSGALTDIVSTSLSAHHQATAGIISSHIYFLSSIPALINLVNSCPISSSPTGILLSLIGDLLFFIGSSIDVGISYISDPELLRVNRDWIYGSSFFSSFLWLIDAILYLAADYWIFHYHDKLYSTQDQPNGNGDNSSVELRSSLQVGWSSFSPGDGDNSDTLLVQGGRDNSPPRWITKGKII